MRFGNASTTVTGTVTTASVKTRVMPHLRPTRPMVIVESSFSASYDWLPLSLHSAGGLGTRDPRPLELHGSRKTGVGTHALRPLKLDREFYTFMPHAQVFRGLGGAPATPHVNRELGRQPPARRLTPADSSCAAAPHSASRRAD